MNKFTEIALKEVHPEWIKLFNNPENNLVDLFDQTVIEVLKTGHKLCPDNPNKILKCLSVNPDDVKIIIVGQD